MSNENQHIENMLDRLTQLGEILKKKEPGVFDDFAAKTTRPLVEDTLFRREATGSLGHTPPPELFSYPTHRSPSPTHRHEKKRHRNDVTITSILTVYLHNQNVVKYDEQKEDTES